MPTPPPPSIVSSSFGHNFQLQHLVLGPTGNGQLFWRMCFWCELFEIKVESRMISSIPKWSLCSHRLSFPPKPDSNHQGFGGHQGMSLLIIPDCADPYSSLKDSLVSHRVQLRTNQGFGEPFELLSPPRNPSGTLQL